MSPAVRSILAVLSLPLGAGCATRAPRDPSLARCDGRRIVVVSNYWNLPVDVYASTGGIVGIVDPGRREEFVLPGAASYAYAVVSYRGSMRRVPRSAVRFRYLCS